MPKTLLEKIVFTLVMAAIMVYGMIVYNVALATGGVTNTTSYYKRVVFIDRSPAVCYTVWDAVDW